MHKDAYQHGQWNVICDRCGFNYKNKQVKRDWAGLFTCHGGGTHGGWEERHPQDFVKGKADRQAPPWVRPESEDVFVGTNDVQPEDL